ncbi:MAG: phosphotransferase [bacterium]|nr:phosphotransferase [bacterium]
MIHIITDIIRKHSDWLRSSHSPLSFMKTSTPFSGTKADQSKVLIFVFEEGEIWPTLCVKTTRTYAGGEVIRRNYTNLKLLEEGVRDSEYSQMFAKPLYLYDDGNIIFYIESVCPGIKFSARGHNLELVMGKYIAWQSHLAQNTKKFQMVENSIRLPLITQHGDMTPDNVLISGKNIYLIDYDCAGASSLAGFDLLNFLSRMKLRPETLHSYYEQYFPRYFKSIGAEVPSYESLLPLYHKEEVNRKTEKL